MNVFLEPDESRESEREREERSRSGCWSYIPRREGAVSYA